MSLDIQVTQHQKVFIPVHQQNKIYLSQPNFILVPESRRPTAIFGDIIPLFKSHQELSDVIITSWESLASFALNSQVLAVCVLSFLVQIVNNITYQSYITLVDGYNTIIALPDSFKAIKNQFAQFLEVLSQEQTRELWWLDTRLSFIDQMDRLIHSLSTTLQIVRKFYLATIIITFLGSLTVSSFASSIQSQSTFARYVDGTSYTTDQLNTQTGLVFASQNTDISFTNATKSATSSIFEYTVQTGDSLESIAEKFSLSTVTVQFNNGVGETLSPGSKLILPWQNAYVYKPSADISAGEIERIYGVSKAEILDANKNIKGELFTKDSLVFIPSSDFAKIAEANKVEEVRKANISKMASVRSSATPDLSQGADIGLIFPTEKAGTRTSRCLEPGHIACDFANFNSPAIFAAKTGKVIVAKYGGWNGGYGNFVKIDHGNGVVTSYMHLTEIYIKEGQSVIQGETIGKMGSTGNSTGIHLHFEVIINGQLQSPGRFLTYMPRCEGSCRS